MCARRLELEELEAATGFEPVNSGFAERIRLPNPLNLLAPIALNFTLRYHILQPMRNHFPAFAKGEELR